MRPDVGVLLRLCLLRLRGRSRDGLRCGQREQAQRAEQCAAAIHQCGREEVGRGGSDVVVHEGRIE